MYVSIGRLDSELLSNSMKVSRGGIIMKSHCCDADTYNQPLQSYHAIWHGTSGALKTRVAGGELPGRVCQQTSFEMG